MYSSGGILTKWKARSIGEVCLVSTLSSKAKKKLKSNHLDVMLERADEVEDSRRTRIIILTTFTAMV